MPDDQLLVKPPHADLTVMFDRTDPLWLVGQEDDGSWRAMSSYYFGSVARVQLRQLLSVGARVQLVSRTRAKILPPSKITTG